MQLENYWVCFEGAIPEHICQKIIDHGCEKEVDQARIGTNENLDELLKIENPTPEQTQEISRLKSKINKTRNSKVSWMNEPWVKRWFNPFILESNSKIWNFQIDENEDYQFTIYEGDKKQHYDWHKDMFLPYPETHWNKKWRKKVRKLSAVIQLTDPSEYEGGNFWINHGDDGPTKKQKEILVEGFKKRGSVLVFPSFLYHKVEPVTFGTRYSLVSWTLGDSFR